MSDDPVRERLVRVVEDNMKRIVVGRLNLDEAIRVCAKAESDYMSAARDWKESAMTLRNYDDRQPLRAAARRGDVLWLAAYWSG